MPTTTLYHTTAHAGQILEEGFIDGSGYYGWAAPQPRGVFLSSMPVSEEDGAEGHEVLAVTLPSESDLDRFAIKEDGHGVWEWCVPASTLKAVASVRLLTEPEVDELLEALSQRLLGQGQDGQTSETPS